jgi:hypothetical protein
VSHDLALGLHGVSSRSQPITLLVDGKSTWNPTWQVWIMFVGIIRNFVGTSLEGRPNKICGGNLDLHYGLVPSERF